MGPEDKKKAHTLSVTSALTGLIRVCPGFGLSWSISADAKFE